MPPLSLACQAFQALTYCRLCAVEIFEQADERVLTGFHRRGTETERHHERAVR